MPSPRTKPSLTSIVAFGMLLAVLYVLSYAPVFRFTVDTETFLYFREREGWQELYVPIEWLTDNTSIREPLLSWAGLWGEEVEEDFRLRSDRRMRGEDPYGEYPLPLPPGRFDGEW